jgi:uncharacterized protein YjiS (DUF1127 family)
MKRHIVRSQSLRERKFFLKALVELCLRSRKSALSRRYLLDLDDRLLRDIGLNRYEILHGTALHSDAMREHDAR